MKMPGKWWGGARQGRWSCEAEVAMVVVVCVEGGGGGGGGQ
eukprot:SAG11_NODE_11684_length_744_cov_1.234109_1_plen_40_part_10